MAKVAIKRYKTRFDRENDQNGHFFGKTAHTVDQLTSYTAEAHSDPENAYLNFFDESGNLLKDYPTAVKHLK